MDTGYAYPFAGGALEDPDAVNLPLPRGANDAEYLLAFDAVWPRALARFAPDAVVLQAGTDVIAPDPLGKLALTTQGFLAAVARVVEGAPRLLATGGGGYHPLLVARAWAGVWALLAGRALPEAMPPAGRGAAARRRAGSTTTTRSRRGCSSPSPTRREPAAIRPEVKALARAAARHPRLA